MPVTRATERLRPRSVRAKIVALLMLPIVSLMALWGFAAVTTASSIGDTERVKDVNAELLAPVDEFVTALQAERTAVTRHAAAPDSAGLDSIEEARTATDEAATAVRNGADAAAADAELLDAGLPARIDRLEGRHTRTHSAARADRHEGRRPDGLHGVLDHHRGRLRRHRRAHRRERHPRRIRGPGRSRTRPRPRGGGPGTVPPRRGERGGKAHHGAVHAVRRGRRHPAGAAEARGRRPEAGAPGRVRRGTGQRDLRRARGR